MSIIPALLSLDEIRDYSQLIETIIYVIRFFSLINRFFVSFCLLSLFVSFGIFNTRQWAVKTEHAWEFVYSITCISFAHLLLDSQLTSSSFYSVQFQLSRHIKNGSSVSSATECELGVITTVLENMVKKAFALQEVEQKDNVFGGIFFSCLFSIQHPFWSSSLKLKKANKNSLFNLVPTLGIKNWTRWKIHVMNEKNESFQFFLCFLRNLRIHRYVCKKTYGLRNFSLE